MEPRENARKMIHFLGAMSQKEEANALRGCLGGRKRVRHAKSRRYLTLLDVGGDEEAAPHLAIGLRRVDLVNNGAEIPLNVAEDGVSDANILNARCVQALGIESGSIGGNRFGGETIEPVADKLVNQNFVRAPG